MSPLLLVIVVLLLAYKFYTFATVKPPGAPPGILRLPIVGSYWFLLWGNYDFPHLALPYYVKKLKSKLISCYFGDYYTIIANDYQSVREVLSREEFDGRLSESIILKARAFGKKLGIFFTDGEQWREQRRFALRHMRDFGFGRRQEKFELDIADELSILVDLLKNGPVNDSEKRIFRDGKALFPDILYALSANSVWLVMFGSRLERGEHEKMRDFCRAGIVFQRSVDTSGGAIVPLPYLRFLGNMFGYQDMMRSNYQMIDFIKEFLEREKKIHNRDDDKGLIDRYLNKLNEVEGEEGSYFSEEQLIMILLDFMFPAITAVPTVMTHCIKYVMHNPEVKKKIQKEIDTVVGTGRFVNWEDRWSLPYTEATIREALRIETLTPFSVIHRCLKDTTLCGYSVPVNTVVITNLAGMNHDPDMWGDPENFRPERFLQDDGQLAKDLTFPFGLGHRLCAGETFARYTLFGMFAVLMQNFDFLFVDGEPTRLEDKIPGLIVTAKETWIRVEQRC